MSFWFSTRSKSGKYTTWSVGTDAFYLLILAMLVFVAISRVPLPIGIGGIASMLMGWALILMAKIELFRKGVWVAWGTSQMNARSARLYRNGYAIIGVAFAIMVIAGLMS